MALGMMMQSGLALLLLLAGVVDDLRARRMHNHLVIAGFVVGLIYIIAVQGAAGLMTAGLSFVTAFVAILPLGLMKILSKKDIKFFLALSLFLNWHQVLLALIATLAWTSILGLIQILAKGQGKTLLENLSSLVRRQKLTEQRTHKFSFEIVLLLGFLTSLVLEGRL
jgi:Flp pilus assembly protein protease CpaA